MTVFFTMRFVLPILVLSLLPPCSSAEEWAWETYGTGQYDGAVTLTDDLGNAFSAIVDPTSPTDPSANIATQPPAVVIAPSGGGGVFQMRPPNTPCDDSVIGQIRWQRSLSQQVCVAANGGYQWTQLDGTIAIGPYAIPQNIATLPFGCQNSWLGADGDQVPNYSNDGKTNTEYLGRPNNEPCQPYLEAIKYCYNLAVNGYDDWYLPAIDQLALIYANRSSSAALNGNTGFFWASTLFRNYCWGEGINFANGVSGVEYRAQVRQVVCTRTR